MQEFNFFALEEKKKAENVRREKEQVALRLKQEGAAEALKSGVYAFIHAKGIRAGVSRQNETVIITKGNKITRVTAVSDDFKVEIPAKATRVMKQNEMMDAVFNFLQD